MGWEVLLVDEVETWLLELDEASYAQVAAAIDKLADDGPQLGRPLVDRVHGSTLHNLKELRPGSAGGTELRVLFVFDAQRQAILLVAGDKSGRWRQWYEQAIPLAEHRYERWECGGYGR